MHSDVCSRLRHSTTLCFATCIKSVNSFFLEVDENIFAADILSGDSVGVPGGKVGEDSEETFTILTDIKNEGTKQIVFKLIFTFQNVEEKLSRIFPLEIKIVLVNFFYL